MARIHEAPVDINKVATSLGFSIEQFPFPDKLKGRVIIKEGIKVIGVNENHPKTLQRYTIAHELGHYLNGHEHIEKTYINDESRYTDSSFHQEKEADAFAAELLMPKFLLEMDLSEIGLEIDSLKEKYIVSKRSPPQAAGLSEELLYHVGGVLSPNAP
jgi:Zn-dependent peptidase ImmA (M78 family)